MTTYEFMTPKGMRGGRFEADSDEEAERIAKEAPWREEVLDMQDSTDEQGNPIVILVVADDEPQPWDGERPDQDYMGL